MDENQNVNTEKVTNTANSRKENFTVTKCVLAGILIFLGAFCAVYVVLDWHFKSFVKFYLPFYSNSDIEKIIKHDMDAMNDLVKFNIPTQKNNEFVRINEDNDFYKIYIDLKPFDNNKDNIEIVNNDNSLTISGKAVKKSKNKEQISQFQQTYMFADNVKLKNMTEDVQGNYLVITIPLSDKDNN